MVAQRPIQEQDGIGRYAHVPQETGRMTYDALGIGHGLYGPDSQPRKIVGPQRGHRKARDLGIDASREIKRAGSRKDGIVGRGMDKAKFGMRSARGADGQLTDAYGRAGDVGPASAYIDDYMNPYEDEVVGATRADMEQEYARVMMANEAAAAASGSFGGSRHGVMDALSYGEQARAMGSTLGDLRFRGFETALGAAENQSDFMLDQASTMGGMAKDRSQMGLNYADDIYDIYSDFGDDRVGAAETRAAGMLGRGETLAGYADMQREHEQALADEPYGRHAALMSMLTAGDVNPEVLGIRDDPQGADWQDILGTVLLGTSTNSQGSGWLDNL